MSFHVLIPARLASARLPNKPLADIGGAPMVVRVAQQALRSQAAQVVVAADSAAIADACAAHGIRAVLTDPTTPAAATALAQACALLGLDGDAMVVNVQGDEPLIDPALINAVAQVLAHTRKRAWAPPPTQCITCRITRTPTWSKWCATPRAWPITSAAPPSLGTATRRVRSGGMATVPVPMPPPLHRCAISASTPTVPGFCANFPPSPGPTEQVEALEQLRALWHGHAIAVHTATQAPGPGWTPRRFGAGAPS